jgi:8-oxo-dGTP pyrophosphatase MutT (NUDIX family)
MKNEKSAGAIIFYLENNQPIFLLLKYTNYWGFVKGNIEVSEEGDVIETVKRESLEEANLEDLRFLPKFKAEQQWFYTFKGERISKNAIFFLAEVKAEDAKNTKISFEHEDFKWLNFEEAIKLLKIKSNKDMLIKANEFIKESSKQKTLF